MKKKTVFEQVSQCRNKLKRGPLWDFSTSILSKNIKKMMGDPSVKKKFEKKVPQGRKYSKRVPFGPLSFQDEVKIVLRKLS